MTRIRTNLLFLLLAAAPTGFAQRGPAIAQQLTFGPYHPSGIYNVGYPNWPSDNPDVMKTAIYFDTTNFASRIQAPVMAGMGFIDAISPPAGVRTALNQIPGPKEPPCRGAPAPPEPMNYSICC